MLILFTFVLCTTAACKQNAPEVSVARVACPVCSASTFHYLNLLKRRQGCQPPVANECRAGFLQPAAVQQDTPQSPFALCTRNSFWKTSTIQCARGNLINDKHYFLKLYQHHRFKVCVRSCTFAGVHLSSCMFVYVRAHLNTFVTFVYDV